MDSLTHENSSQKGLCKHDRWFFGKCEPKVIRALALLSKLSVHPLPLKNLKYFTFYFRSLPERCISLHLTTAWKNRLFSAYKLSRSSLQPCCSPRKLSNAPRTQEIASHRMHKREFEYSVGFPYACGEDFNCQR